MKYKKSWVIFLALMFSLAACGKPAGGPSQAPEPNETQTSSPPPSEAPNETPLPSGSESPGEDPSETPADSTVRLAFLNGPTGMGADIDSGAVTGYSYEVAADNSEVVNLLAHGDVDIAALATNVALNLYNKSEDVQMLALNTRGVLYILEGKGTQEISSVADLQGKTLFAFGQGANPQYILDSLLAQNGLDGGDVQMLALNTRGVLYVLEGKGTQEINSVADLQGRTVYAFGQGANPQYILGDLLAQNGLDEESVDLQWATPEEVTQALLSGKADAAMLPVPAATAAVAKGQGQVRQAVDLTRAWEEAYGSTGSGLYMGCLVARRDFVKENPQAVADFLDAYRASVEFVTGDPAAAAPLAEARGLAPSAAIAEQAIPACNLCFVTGSGMAEQVTPYYEALFRADPAAIGGSLPDDGFYYVP